MSKESPGHTREKQLKLANKLICNFIAEKFLSPPKDETGKVISQNEYALGLGISSSVLTKMKKDEGYDIPFSTIYLICQKENLLVSELLAILEKEYPDLKTT